MENKGYFYKRRNEKSPVSLNWASNSASIVLYSTYCQAFWESRECCPPQDCEDLHGNFSNLCPPQLPESFGYQLSLLIMRPKQEFFGRSCHNELNSFKIGISQYQLQNSILTSILTNLPCQRDMCDGQLLQHTHARRPTA